MSARDEVWSLLTQDAVLNGMGIDTDTTWPAQSLDTAPRNRRFLILRWEETTPSRNGKSQITVLTIWAHCPREMSTDFAPLDAILKRCTEVLTSAADTPGGLTCVDYNGMSPDLNDEGYKTITRNAAYTIVSR